MTNLAHFGPLIVETDIDDAVVSVLRTWLPTYLGQIEVERSLTPGYLPRPVAGSYANTLLDDEFLDHQLPAIIVTTAQTQGTPEKSGDGVYYASWEVVVSAIVRGRKPPETRHTAALYGGSVRRVMVQQLPDSVSWESGHVAPVSDPTSAGRYLAAAINHFRVEIDEALSVQGAPTVPDAPPYVDGVPVKKVTNTFEGVPLPSEHPVV